MKADTITLAVSGAGGYGHWYIKKILELQKNQEIQLAAVFDPNIRQVELYAELKDLKISCFDDYSEFVKALKNVRLVVIASPIQFHSLQTIDALNQGCNVLLDKPLAGDLQQAKAIQEAIDKTQNWVMVGYQWSFSKAIRTLKSDLVAGQYGKIRSAKTLVFWPRGFDYYGRNDWAGRKVSASGVAINDSPINNAMAHFVHNLLYLAGDSLESSATPIRAKAELYRAYPVETFDTAVVHLKTSKQIKIGFYVSHATKNPKGPLFIIECEKAVIYYGELSSDITAVKMNGGVVSYGDPEATDQFYKLEYAIKACAGELEPICPVSAAIQQTRLIQALSNLEPALEFNSPIVIENPDDRRYVEGLGYMLYASYQQGVMPSKKFFPIKGKIQKFKID